MKNMFVILAIYLSFFSIQIASADDSELAIVDGKELTVGNKKILYTYKQYEKFDFDDLNIEGDTGAPSDLSISPILEKRFTNRLPYRKSFTVEIKKGMERVR
jgi:hypothetical protein